MGRGLIADRDLLVERRRVVSYYRLSGYTFPFPKPGQTDTGRPQSDLQPGTSFEVVWRRYVFDRRLRLLLMDAIERIEVASRTAIAYHHAHAFDPFAYAADPASLPGLDKNDRIRLLESMHRECRRSKEPFVRHFLSKCGSHHGDLPIWMAVETVPFGTILTMYRGCPSLVRKEVSQQLAVQAAVFESWLLTLCCRRF